MAANRGRFTNYTTDSRFANFSNSASKALRGSNAQLVFAALINKLKHAKDKVQFFRDLQTNYPLVWEALERVAKEMRIIENLNFITQTKDLESNGSFDSIYKSFFADEVDQPNVDSDERISFLNNYKTDKQAAKQAVEKMLSQVSEMLTLNIVQKPTMGSKFREEFPKVLESHKENSQTSKKKH